MNWYNGFSPEERARRGYKRSRKHPPASIRQPPCSMCGDPKPPKIFSHAEDYSVPYKWDPPASYPLCAACHARLHNRFQRPQHWYSYLAFLRRGYYGQEVTSSDINRLERLQDAFVWKPLNHVAPLETNRS